MRYIFVFILFTACQFKKPIFENKSFYAIKKGELVNLYYSTNSCCRPCLNRENFKCIEYLNDSLVDRGDENCAGCNMTSVLVFRGKSVGIDTIRLGITAVSQTCDSLKNWEEYVIEVK